MSHPYTPVAAALTTVTLPDDITDLRTAASVNTPFQTLADAVAYAQFTRGSHKIVGYMTTGFSDASDTYVPVNDTSGSPFSFTAASYTSNKHLVDLVPVLGPVSGDILVLSLSGSLLLTNTFTTAMGPCFFRMAKDSTGSQTILGAKLVAASLPNVTSLAGWNMIQPFKLQGVTTYIPGAGDTGKINLDGKVWSNPDVSFQMVGSWNLTVLQLRETP